MLKLIILNPRVKMLFMQDFYGVLKLFLWYIVFVWSLCSIVCFYEGGYVFRDFSLNKVIYAFFLLLMKSEKEGDCGGIYLSL